jgi:glucokinase
MAGYKEDSRIVLALDAGGTSFRFFALRGQQPLGASVVRPSHGNDLPQCLSGIIAGFEQVKQQCPVPPSAISFAFPAPADYPNGIIGDLWNLPGFRGGVALGPMLEDRFGIPVFINNDGDLFTYGEAIAGFLPYVNGLLEKASSPKRFKNLFGVTLGTGFGGGIVRDGHIFIGDNSMGGEVWLLRNKIKPETSAEEGASIRAVRRVYAQHARIPFDQSPEPRIIFDIAQGRQTGAKDAALEAFRQLGQVTGDAMGQALTLVDCLAVIGGGISGAWPVFLPALIAQLDGTFHTPDGKKFRRLASAVFNLEEPAQLQKFVAGETREVVVPGGTRKIRYDALQRIGVGISRLGTSEATAIGAYAFALQKLDQKK